jgi:nucleoside-diphosphate-sugar epimerase
MGKKGAKEVGRIYFFTGFPGFIASMLLEELIAKWAPEKIYTLVLPDMKDKATAEKERICSLTRFPQEKWEVVEGDITKPNLALSAQQLNSLAQSVTHVFHLAAIYDLAVPEDLARLVNVEGTKHVNEWLRSLPHLQRYVYFSTAYVSGTRQGVIFEHELDEGQTFKNHYEETKFLAEIAVREAACSVPTTIIRPGIVVGHSKTGETMKFDGLYFMLNMFERLKFLPIIPYLGNGEAQGNFVPVDYIVEAALYLAHADEAAGETYHLTDPKPYKMRDIYRMMMRHYLGKEPRGTLPLAFAKWAMSFSFVRKWLRVEKEALEYFECASVYDATKARDVLAKAGIACPDFRDVIPVLARYYRKHQHDAAKQLPIR